MAHLKNIFALLAAAALATACSPRTIALRQTAALVKGGASALYEEPDPQLARESFGAQLKLIEVLLRNEPDNETLLQLTTEGFGGFAFLFLEDADPARAKGFYRRARDHGLRRLARRRELSGFEQQDVDSIEKALVTAKLDDAPALFWTAFAWAGEINLSRDSPSLLAELPKAVALMERARQLSPGYHFAGADLFFGVYYASRPAILGGDLGKARAAFQEARRRTSGQYLMTYVLEARYYAVAAQDKELFTTLLNKVQDLPAGQLPDARLSDEIAKIKARTLLGKKDELF